MSTPGPRTRLFQAVLASVVVLAGVLGFTGIASAHHANITANAGCGGVVNFTATAWEGNADDAATPLVNEYELSRTNPTIEIAFSTAGVGGPYTVLTQKPAYRFDVANGFTFTDTFTISQPLPPTVVVRAHELANWANGNGPGAAQFTQALTVTGCAGASIGDIVCAEGGAAVTLDNPTPADVTFTITKGQTTVATSTVPASGGHVVVPVPFNEDETATVTVTAPGTTAVSRELTRNCDHPAASIGDVVCADAGATVTLTNAGAQVPVHFVVSKGSAVVEEADVAPDATKTVSVPFAEDESATVTVTAPNMTTVSRDLARNCQRPGATIADAICSAGGATVTLTNTGGLLPVTFTISDGVHPETTFVVAAGGTATPTAPVAEDTTVTLTVSAPGMTLVTKSVSLDCQHPAAAVAAIECATDGAAVTMTNLTAELPVHFVVTKNGTPFASYDVPAGGTATSVVPMAEDESALIAANAPDMVEAARNVTRDCQHPAAVIADATCSEGGALVTLTNAAGELPIRFSITKTGAEATLVDVAPNASVTHTVALAEDETTTITVAAPGMAPVTKQVTLDCVEAVVAPAATTNPVSGVLGNGLGRGGPAVGAGTLPRTGSSTTLPLTLGGLGLLGLGVVLVGVGRRRQVEARS